MHPKTFRFWETVATCATGALGRPPMSLPLAWSLLCIGRVVLNFDSPGYEAKPRNDGRVAGPTPKDDEEEVEEEYALDHAAPPKYEEEDEDEEAAPSKGNVKAKSRKK